MRFLGITDLHGNLAALERILTGAGPVDAVLLGGDLTNFGSPDEAERIVQRTQLAAPNVWAVAGNCDSAEIDRRLVDLGVSLVGRGVVCDGVALHGLSAMPPWRSDMYQFTEEELAETLDRGYQQVAGAPRRVLLTHAPPRGGPLDRTFLGRHVGSTAIRRFIERTEPMLVVCGHIHEARGLERTGRATIVNCGHARRGHHALIDLATKPRVELRKA